MRTNTPNFKVVANKSGKDIPVIVAGNIMTDVQSLIVHIGEQLIGKEMYAVYKIPSEYLNRFILHISHVEGRSVTLSAGTDDGYTGALMDEAVRILTEIFDRSGDGSLADRIFEMFPDPRYMSWIVSDLNALSSDMSGYSIQYESMGSVGVFKGVPEELSCVEPEPNEQHGSAIGTIIQAPDNLKMVFDFSEINLYFKEDVAKADAKDLSNKMLGRVYGELIFSKRGTLMEIRDIYKVEPVKGLSFKTIVSQDRDVTFATPVYANISYNGKEWAVSNKDANLEIKSARWDDAVRMFHNMFMLCFESCCARKNTESCNDPVSKYICSLSPVNRK